mmetsp:Transcript_15620/g.22881  ORF Transcript_15620/g.22881 Transcript_15620/m.22881 type:complete len:180 (-) Transcript_15620:528-1067(-)
MTRRGIPLTFHSSHPKPQRVRFKLEMQTSDSTENPQVPTEPHIVWEVLEQGSYRKSRLSKRKKEQIRLFDISSIQKGEDSPMNFSTFRSANARHSILITLSDGNVFLFEASDEYEAKKVIHGIRWVEARLTFNIIIGNTNVCSEMLSLGTQKAGDMTLTSGDMLDMTNQLVENSMKKLT